MTKALLVLNAGSSSLKFAVYGHAAELPLLLKGSISQLGHEPRLKIRCAGAVDFERALGAGPMSLQNAVQTAVAALGERGMIDGIGTVGHRIVHGGQSFTKPAILDRQTLDSLRRLAPLAPLHQPYNLDIVDLTSGRFPAAIQIGAFDTAFHADRLLCDRLYGLPRPDRMASMAFLMRTLRVVRMRDKAPALAAARLWRIAAAAPESAPWMPDEALPTITAASTRWPSAGGGQQEVDQYVVELANKAQYGMRSRRRRQFVRAVQREAACGLAGIQPLFGRLKCC